jgi:SAM-dependent MidA family methyltransferase
VVVEGGAGAGTLAVAVLAAQPACLAALRYVLVERSDALRARHGEYLAIESAAHAFAPDRTEHEEEAAAVDMPTGPIVVSLAELPRIETHVVLANELLDNLPVDLVEGEQEVRVGLDGERLVEALVPATASLGVAGRAPVQHAAAGWIRDARALGARVVAFDYADTTASMASRPFTDWLRTYRGHHRGSAVLDDLGRQDITCVVAVDQLPPPTANTEQAAWLRGHGLDDLVAQGRATWAERAHLGDLEAIRARSRITEADALTDPAGLGAFRVLEWE